jgi:hypothetical protein
MWHLRRNEPILPPAEEADLFDGDESLGDECDAFLRGRYLWWLMQEGLPVHGWAWFNRAAHGSFVDIARHVERLGVPAEPCCFGHAAQLVEAMVVASVAPADLREVQRHLLVPLELGLVSRQRSPRAVVELVSEALS